VPGWTGGGVGRLPPQPSARATGRPQLQRAGTDDQAVAGVQRPAKQPPPPVAVAHACPVRRADVARHPPSTARADDDVLPGDRRVVQGEVTRTGGSGPAHPDRPVVARDGDRAGVGPVDDGQVPGASRRPCPVAPAAGPVGGPGGGRNPSGLALDPSASDPWRDPGDLVLGQQHPGDAQWRRRRRPGEPSKVRTALTEGGTLGDLEVAEGLQCETHRVSVRGRAAGPSRGCGGPGDAAASTRPARRAARCGSMCP